MKKSELRKLIAESIKQLNEQDNTLVNPEIGSNMAGGVLVHCPLGYSFVGEPQPLATAVTGLTPNLETDMLEQAFQLQGDFPFTGLSMSAAGWQAWDIVETVVSGMVLPKCAPHAPKPTIGGGGWQTDQTTNQFGLTDSFCCDTDASNYCEYQSGEDVEQCDEYIMAYGPEGDLCDITLCSYMYGYGQSRSKKSPRR